jgi:hypothetical protein
MGLLWTSDQPDVETSTLQYKILKDVYAPAVFEPIISERGRPLTYSLECAATGTGAVQIILLNSTFGPNEFSKNKGNGTAVPLQAWSGPEVSRKLRFPDFMTTAQGGGGVKVVSITYRPHLPPENTRGSHFC